MKALLIPKSTRKRLTWSVSKSGLLSYSRSGQFRHFGLIAAAEPYLSFRPAYMDEYEKLESELHKLYSTYVQKFRNLSYLEAMLNEYDKAELERTTVCVPWAAYHQTGAHGHLLVRRQRSHCDVSPRRCVKKNGHGQQRL